MDDLIKEDAILWLLIVPFMYAFYWAIDSGEPTIVFGVLILMSALVVFRHQVKNRRD